MNKILFLVLSCIVVQGTINAMEKKKLTIVQPQKSSQSTPPSPIEPPQKGTIASPMATADAMHVIQPQMAKGLQAATIATGPEMIAQPSAAVAQIQKPWELFSAISMGELEKVRILLDTPGLDLNGTWQNGFTPLHQAASDNQPTIVQLLLDRGANINQLDLNGRTPLHQATFLGHPEIVQLLLEHGADVYIVDRGGDTPILRAGYNRASVTIAIEQLINDHIARSFYHRPDRPAPSVKGASLPEKQLAAAAAPRKKLSIQWTQKHDESTPPSPTEPAQQAAAASAAKVNVCDSHTRGPITEAAEISVLEQLRSSLEAGVDVTLQDNQGRTKLHEAACTGHQQVVQFLLDHGANVNIPDKEGCTPLHLAARFSHQKIVQLLLERRANVNWQNSFGRTPLHFASICSHPKVIQLLLDCGAIVNQQDIQGETSLHSAIEKGGNLAAVQILLDRGAEINSRNCLGATPLHYAASLGGQQAVVKLLLNRGARVNLQVRAGKTPLDVAIQTGNQEAVQLIKDHTAHTGVAAASPIAHTEPEAICPICTMTISEIGAANRASTPCCRQFICRGCFTQQRACNHKCPLCRSRVGWE